MPFYYLKTFTVSLDIKASKVPAIIAYAADPCRGLDQIVVRVQEYPECGVPVAESAINHLHAGVCWAAHMWAHKPGSNLWGSTCFFYSYKATCITRAHIHSYHNHIISSLLFTVCFWRIWSQGSSLQILHNNSMKMNGINFLKWSYPFFPI